MTSPTPNAAVSANAADVPPPRLADVVQALSLPSFVAPSAWQPLRELAAKVEEARERERKAHAALQDVETAIYSAGTRRSVDVAALADAVLAGSIPSAEPEPQREGLAALPVERLRAIRDGLQQKVQEARADVRFYEDRLRVVGRELLREAASVAAAEYARMMEPLATLHRAIDAAHSLLGSSGTPVVGPGWRTERWLAPALGVDKAKVIRSWGHPDDALHDFSGGGGVSAARDEWRAAFRAAVGVEFN